MPSLELVLRSGASGLDRLTLGRPKRYGFHEDARDARIELFEPYETASSPDHIVGFASSVISSDVYNNRFKDSLEEEGPVGKIVLFRLDHSEADLTAKNLEIGKNCIYGALVIDGGIKPFRLVTKTRGDRVVQEIQRKDPTEESGVSTEASLVQKGGGGTYLDIEFIDDGDLEFIEVMEELKKFIASREKTNN